MPSPKPPPSPLLSIDADYSLFSSTVLRAAHAHIPLLCPSPNGHQTPWWTPQCTTLHARKQRLYSLYKRSPSSYNLIAYKAANSYCRRILRRTRRQYFRSYVSSLTSPTPPHNLYKVIHSFTHHNPPNPFPALRYGPAPLDVTSVPAAAADILGYTFAQHSDPSSYPPEFQRTRSSTTVPSFHTPTSSFLPYNSPFSPSEYNSALHSLRKGAPGPDLISLPFLRHLHPTAHSFLLHIINKAWLTSLLPSIWTTATVVPIPKPGKDPSLPDNYRPISLPPVPSKLTEKMVLSRLTPLLDSLHARSSLQFAYRHNTSTIDPLLILDHDIRHSFHHKHQTLAVFLDLTRAFDATWRDGILLKIHSLGLRDALPQYIHALLSNRSIRVRLHTVYSRPFLMSEGVPQGGVLSGLLFSLALNDITLTIPSSVRISLYADDVLYASGPLLPSLERRLQLALNKCSSWALSHGFSFSPTKSSVLLFTRPWSRSDPSSPPPSLSPNPPPLPIKPTHRFLGVTLDSRLSYKPHIAALRSSCHRLLDLLAHIAHPKWGLNRPSLLRLYKSLVRSRLEYGCEVYSQVPPSSISSLNSVQNRALRIATGAFHSTPIKGLELLTATLPIPPPFHYRQSCTFARLHTAPSPALDSILQFQNLPSYWPFATSICATYSQASIPLHSILSLPPPLVFPPPLPAPLNTSTSLPTLSKRNTPRPLCQSPYNNPCLHRRLPFPPVCRNLRYLSRPLLLRRSLLFYIFLFCQISFHPHRSSRHSLPPSCL